jgi:signal transduction histidine kinase/CheY-like chemotaxis protein
VSPDVPADPSQLGMFLHGTQAAANLLIALLLFFFQRVYRRPFLLHWGLAWAALTVFHLGAAFGTELARLPLADPVRCVVGALTLSASYAHAAWLLSGTWSLGARRPLPHRAQLWLALLPFALGGTSVVASLPLTTELRAFVRVGLPGLAVGLAFVLAAAALARGARREPSPARWLVAGLLGFLAMTEIGRFLNQHVHLDEQLPAPLSTLAMTHFVAFSLQLLLLSGLVFWFFEEERADLLRATNALAESEKRRLRAEHMEAVGRLAGGVAHDFNNLLTAILGHAELLLARAELGHRDREDLVPITRAAGRAAVLVRELLTFSRRQPHVPRHFVLDELLGDMRKMLEPLLGTNVGLRLELGAPGAVVFADPGQIELSVLNLATNARDALTGGGQFVLRTSVVEVAPGGDPVLTPGHHLRLDVRDTGSGIRADHLPRIFEPFYTTKPGKGTGLGLASVHGIVKQSGGEIRVESEPGQGTTFQIWLPLAAGPVERREELAPVGFPRGGNETLLLVEDDPDVRLTTQRQLVRAGYRVTTADDVDGALRHLRAPGARFDLVLCDLVLPGRAPGELFLELEREHPGCALLLMSAHSEASLRQRGLDPGRKPFLAKPFRAAGLLESVRTTLDRKHPLEARA